VSEENVELVRRTFDAFEVGGFEAMMPLFSDEVVWYAAPGWLEDLEYRGHDGTRKLTSFWAENINDFSLVARDIRDLQDRVLVLVELTGRTKEGDIPLHQLSAMVYSRFHGGTIGEVRFYITWQDALAAVGLDN
jgi:ketosteroid isomerase-like protein